MMLKLCWFYTVKFWLHFYSRLKIDCPQVLIILTKVWYSLMNFLSSKKSLFVFRCFFFHFSKYPELYKWFKDFLGYKESGGTTESIPMGASGKERVSGDLAMEIGDLFLCKSFTHCVFIGPFIIDHLINTWKHLIDLEVQCFHGGWIWYQRFWSWHVLLLHQSHKFWSFDYPCRSFYQTRADDVSVFYILRSRIYLRTIFLGLFRDKCRNLCYFITFYVCYKISEGGNEFSLSHTWMVQHVNKT